MNSFILPLDQTICDEIEVGLYHILTRLEVDRVLDIPTFAVEKGYPPVCSSVFMIGNGGSYTHEVSGEVLSVHNGTLVSYGGRVFKPASDQYEMILRGRLP